MLPGLVMALAMAGFEPAEAQEAEIDVYLRAAVRLYENLEYERALDQLGRARELSRGVDDDVKVAFYEGIIFAEMGRSEDSAAAFKAGLFLRPDAGLPLKVSPKILTEFEALRVQVKAELAPILAKREEERRQAEEAARKAEAERARLAAEEERRRQEEANRLAEQKAAAEAARKEAEEAKRAAEKAKGEAEAQRLAAEAEEKRLAAEAEVRRLEAEAERRRLEAETKEEVVAVVDPGSVEDPSSAFRPDEKPPRRKVGALPFVFGGAALAAGGVGGFFGLQSKGAVADAESAVFQDDANAHLERARGQALVANVLFATAGGAAAAALLTLLTGGEPAPTESGP